MSERVSLKCFVETEDGLDFVELIFEDKEYYGAWVNHDLADHCNSFKEFLDEYGPMYYDTKEDYKKSNHKLFQKWEIDQFGEL